MNAFRISAATSPGSAYLARFLVLAGAADVVTGRSCDSHELSGSGVRVRLFASPSSCPVLVMLIAPFRATLPQPFCLARSPASWRLRCSGVRDAGGRDEPYREVPADLVVAPRGDEGRRVVPALESRYGRDSLGARGSSRASMSGRALGAAPRRGGRGVRALAPSLDDWYERGSRALRGSSSRRPFVPPAPDFVGRPTFEALLDEGRTSLLFERRS